MLTSGIKGIMLAAGLALAGFGASAQAQPAAAASPVPYGIAPANAADAAAPMVSATPAPLAGDQAIPASEAAPETAMDGAPAMMAAPKIGQPTDGVFGIQPQVTKNGLRAHWFHDKILFPLISLISLFVLILLVVVIVRFRASANPVPSKTSHNTFIEVVWTLVPVLILVAIAVPSIGLLNAQFKPAPAGAVTLKAIGNQWFWSYQYPDHGGIEITANMLKERGDPSLAPGDRFRTDADGPRLLATDNRVVLPVGVPIRLITTANDVIHSWAMPAFWIKLDAIPGRLNETSFTIDKPGLYFGQCSELCGARHGFMPIAVEAVPPAQFARWVVAKGGKMPVPGKSSDAVIPQPGADNSAAAAAEMNQVDAMTAPTENVSSTSITSPQGATGNPGGVGQAGR